MGGVYRCSINIIQKGGLSLKFYEAPEILIHKLILADIVATSGGGGWAPPIDGDDEDDNGNNTPFG